MPAAPTSAEVARWIRELPDTDKNDLLLRLAEGNEQHLRAEIVRRAAQSSKPAAVVSAVEPNRRTVAALLAAAEEQAKIRQQREADRAAKERARRDKERAAYLDGLVTRVDELWSQVEALAETKRPTDYDQATTLLRDLHDVSARGDKLPVFEARLSAFRSAHLNRPSLLRRIAEAGLNGR